MACSTDIAELCSIVRGFSASTGVGGVSSSSTQGSSSVFSDESRGALTTLTCAKLLIVLSLAAHELLEDREGAAAIRRACVEAAYRDFKHSPFTSTTMLKRHRIEAAVSSTHQRKTSRKIESLVRNAAVNGYERSLLRSYTGGSCTVPFVVKRWSSRGGADNKAIEIVSVSFVDVLEEAKQLCAIISASVPRQQQCHLPTAVVAGEQNTDTLATGGEQPADMLREWMSASFCGPLAQRQAFSSTSLPSSLFEPLGMCTTAEAEVVNCWGVAASLVMTLLRASGISSHGLEESAGGRRAFVLLQDLSLEGLIVKCLTEWRRPSGTLQHVPTTVLVEPMLGHAAMAQRSSFTGLSSSNVNLAKTAPTTHPFASHLSVSSFLLTHSNSSCSAATAKDANSNGFDGPLLSVLRSSSLDCLYQQTRALIGLAYDPKEDTVDLQPSSLFDPHCAMSTARHSRCGWSAASRAANFAMCLEAAWVAESATDGAMEPSDKIAAASSANSRGDTAEVRNAAQLHSAGQRIGYFSLDEMKLLPVPKEDSHANSASGSPTLTTTLVDRISFFIGDTDPNTRRDGGITADQLASFFSVLSCRHLAISSTSILSASSGDMHRDVASSQLCFANMRVSRLLHPPFLAVLLSRQVPSMLQRDPTGGTLAAMLPSLVSTTAISFEDLHRHFVDADLEDAARLDEIPCSKDLRGGLLRVANRRGLQMPLDEAATVYFAWKLLFQQVVAAHTRTNEEVAVRRDEDLHLRCRTLRNAIARHSMSIVHRELFRRTHASRDRHHGNRDRHHDSDEESSNESSDDDDSSDDAHAVEDDVSVMQRVVLHQIADHLAAFSTSHSGRVRAKFTDAVAWRPNHLQDQSHGGVEHIMDDDGTISIDFLNAMGIAVAVEQDATEMGDVEDGQQFVIEGSLGRPAQLRVPKLREEETADGPVSAPPVDASPDADVSDVRPSRFRLSEGDLRVLGSTRPANSIPSNVFHTLLGLTGTALDVTDGVVVASDVATLMQSTLSIANRRADALSAKLESVHARLHGGQQSSDNPPPTHLASTTKDFLALGALCRVQAAATTTAMHFPSQYALRYTPQQTSQQPQPSVGLAGLLPLAGPSLVTLEEDPQNTGGASPGTSHVFKVAPPGGAAVVSHALLDIATVELEAVVDKAAALSEATQGQVAKVRETRTQQMQLRARSEDQLHAAAREDRKRQLLLVHRSQLALRHDGLGPLGELVAVDGDALAEQIANIRIGSTPSVPPLSSTLMASTPPQDVSDVAALLSSTRQLHHHTSLLKDEVAKVEAKRRATADLKLEVLSIRTGLLNRIEDTKAQRKAALETLQSLLQSKLNTFAIDEQRRRATDCSLLREEVSSLRHAWAYHQDLSAVEKGLRDEHNRLIAGLEDELANLLEVQQRVRQEQELFAGSLIGRWNAPHVNGGAASPSSSSSSHSSSSKLKNLKPRRYNTVCFLGPYPPALTKTAAGGAVAPWHVASTMAVAEGILVKVQQGAKVTNVGGLSRPAAVDDSFVTVNAKELGGQHHRDVLQQHNQVVSTLWCDETASFAARTLHYNLSVQHSKAVIRSGEIDPEDLA